MGWHTARTLLPPPPPRSSGAPVRWLMARGRRARGVAAAPRSHAAGAPAARRRRAVGGACAFKRPAKNLWWWWWWWHQRRITSGWLPLFGGSTFILLARSRSVCASVCLMDGWLGGWAACTERQTGSPTHELAGAQQPASRRADACGGCGRRPAAPVLFLPLHSAGELFTAEALLVNWYHSIVLPASCLRARSRTMLEGERPSGQPSFTAFRCEQSRVNTAFCLSLIHI